MPLDIQERLMDFISQQYRIDKSDIDLEGNLVDQGVIDSFGFVEMATFLEKELSVVIANDQVNTQNFGSIRRIVDFVETLAGLPAHGSPCC